MGGARPLLSRSRLNRWTDAWCKPPGHDPAAVERILAAVPQPRPCTVQFQFSPGLLQAAMRSMQGRAAGADDWRPSEISTSRAPGGTWPHSSGLPSSRSDGSRASGSELELHCCGKQDRKRGPYRCSRRCGELAVVSSALDRKLAGVSCYGRATGYIGGHQPHANP